MSNRTSAPGCAEMRAFLPGWVGELRSAGHTILIATHDRAPFAALVDAVIVVHDGSATIAGVTS